MRRQLWMSDHATEQSEKRIISSGDHNPSICAGKCLKWSDRRMARAASRRDDIGCRKCCDGCFQECNLTIKHGDIDQTTFASASSFMDRARHAKRHIQPSNKIPDGCANAHRRSMWMPCQTHHAAECLRNDVVRRQRRKWSSLSKSRKCAINQLGPARMQRVPSISKLFHHMRRKVFHQHVGVIKECFKYFSVIGIFQIKRD